MKHRLKLNLLASWGDHLTGVLIGLFLMPFVLRTIGDEQYGVWLFVCSIAGYSGLLNLGFGETVSRFVAHHRARGEVDRINQIVTGIGSVYLAMSVLILIVSGVIGHFAFAWYDWGTLSASDLRTVIVLLGLNVVTGLLGSVFGGVIIGVQRFDLERAAKAVSGIARLVMTVVFLQKQQALTTLAVIFLVTTLIENIGLVLIAFRQLPGLRIGFRHFRRSTLQECFGFSVFALLDNIASKLIEATDTVLIGLAFGSKAIVPYYVAQRLMTFIVQPLQLIGNVAMPRGAELEAGAHDARLRVLVQKGLGLAFLLTTAFFIGAVYFGDEVLTAWIGQGYPESHAILLILLGSQVIATPMRVLRGVLFGMGHVRLPALVYFAEAVTNLGLSLLLIKPFGLIGIALGTAIPVVLFEAAVLMPFALSKLKFAPREFLHAIVLPQCLPLLLLWTYSLLVASCWAVPGTWGPVLLVAVGGGIVLGLTWLAGWKRQVRRSALMS